MSLGGAAMRTPQRPPSMLTGASTPDCRMPQSTSSGMTSYGGSRRGNASGCVIGARGGFGTHCGHQAERGHGVAAEEECRTPRKRPLARQARLAAQALGIPVAGGPDRRRRPLGHVGVRRPGGRALRRRRSRVPPTRPPKRRRSWGPDLGRYPSLCVHHAEPKDDGLSRLEL